MMGNKKLALPAVLLLASAVRGADVPTITVSSVGKVDVLPQALQVMLFLKGKGADVAGAVAAIKEMREKFAAEFTKLGAQAESFKADPPTMVQQSPQDAARRQMEALKRGGRLSRKKPEEEKKAPEVKMQRLFRARIPLKGKDVTALIIEAEGIKAKLKAATAELVKAMADAKEEDLSDDDRMMMQRMMYNQEGEAQGGLNFTYFAPTTDALRDQALQDAVKKAKEEATRVAKALGKTGVAFRSVQCAGDSVQQQMMGAYANMYYDRYGRPRGGQPPTDGLSSTTAQMSISMTLSVTFVMK